MVRVKRKRGRPKKWDIKRVKLNNKSRKGWYIRVREIKKKIKYYKEKKGISEKDYKYYYSKGITSKRGGISKKTLIKERKIDRVAKKYPKVEDVIGSGYAEYTMRNAKMITPYGMKTAYMKLLLNKDGGGDGKPIVRDKELLELITRSENVDKWKHRILFEVHLKNERGEMLATISNTTIKLIGELKKEVLNEIHLNEDYEGQYRRIMDRVSNKGYRVNQGTTKKGRVKIIDVKMIFRKA